jgi:hypothetical protein
MIPSSAAGRNIQDWRRHAVLLNAVSGFAQIGQYGIAFPLLSLWL